MELPSFDKHCSHKDCKQLDFLPLQCKCKQLFCSEHFAPHREECCETAANITDCKSKIESLFKCSVDGCKNTSLVALICEKCQKHFCVTHRHVVACSPADPESLALEKEKYAAPLRQFNEIKASIDLTIESKLSSAKKTKNAATANKVQLMRIKNKATGLKTIPVTDRVYFAVQQQKNGIVSPVFISKTWTVGRAIDAIASELRLQNSNNKADALKLRLFRKEDLSIVSKDLSQIIEVLLNSGVVSNGDTLIIEYVNDDCVSLNVNE